MGKYANIIFNNVPLSEYCKENNIQYSSIYSSIKYSIKNNLYQDLTLTDRINLILDNYRKRSIIKFYKTNFEMLKDDSIKISDLCKNLNLNYSKLKKLLNDELDIKQLIIISWFSSDKQNQNGSFITLKRLLEIKNYINTDINDLIALHKIGVTDSLERILSFESKYIRGIIRKILSKCNIRINQLDYQDLYMEAQLILIETINKIVCNKCGQIVNYIYISVSKKLLDYIVKNYFTKTCQYIDNYKYKGEVLEY